MRAVLVWPPITVRLNNLEATSVAVQGITTIGEEAQYTITAAFNPTDIAFIDNPTQVGAACPGVNTFTYITSGPLSVLQSLQAFQSQEAIIGTSTPAVNLTTPPPTSTTHSTASHAATAAHHAPKTITSSAAASLAVGCLLAGALLALAAVLLVSKRRRGRAPPAATAGGARAGYVDAAAESEVRHRPVPVAEARARPVEDGRVVVRGVGVGVEVEDMPESRAR